METMLIILFSPSSPAVNWSSPTNNNPPIRHKVKKVDHDSAQQQLGNESFEISSQSQATRMSSLTPRTGKPDMANSGL